MVLLLPVSDAPSFLIGRLVPREYACIYCEECGDGDAEASVLNLSVAPLDGKSLA